MASRRTDAVHAAIQLLQAAGRDSRPELVRDVQLPPVRWFAGVFAHPAAWVGSTGEEVEWLIRGMILLERERPSEYQFGSVPPVAALYRLYVTRCDERAADDLAEWVLANATNEYVPFGTSNHGARSLSELRAAVQSLAERRRHRSAAEAARALEASSRRAEEATLRMANAIRRRDVMAIRALVAKGADLKRADASGTTLGELISRAGIELSVDSAAAPAEPGNSPSRDAEN